MGKRPLGVLLVMYLLLIQILAIVLVYSAGLHGWSQTKLRLQINGNRDVHLRKPRRIARVGCLQHMEKRASVKH